METVRFDELNLYPQVLRAIKEMGFEEATPIQSRAIPAVMSGADVIGQAQTGTGKTASFGIPVLHKADVNSKKTQVLILSPTRELAIQVCEEIRKLGGTRNATKGTVQGRKIPLPKNFKQVFERLNSQKDTAAVYKVSISTVRRWMKDCNIPYQKDRKTAQNYKKQVRADGKFGGVKK